MPTPRTVVGAAYVDGQAYVVGGRDASGATVGTNEGYDPAADAWAEQAAMTPRFGAAAAAVGDELLAFGGFDVPDGTNRQALASNESYDPSQDVWTERSPLPTPRGLAAAATVGGLVYVLGGTQADGTVLAVNEIYDPQADSWSTGPPLSVARAGIGAAAVGSSIVLCGGADENEQTLTLTESFDAEAGTYTECAPMPTARWLAGCAAAQRGIYVLGGFAFATDAPQLQVNEVYDPVADAWTTQDPIPVTALYPAAVGVTGVVTGDVCLFALSAFPSTAVTLVYEVSPFGR
jgi:N-acetylneuraminic acid mutarotase